MTDIGRVVVPPAVPEGYALFYTTTDSDGRLNGEIVDALMSVLRERFGIEATLTTCTQVHGAKVVHAMAAEAAALHGDVGTCDALWSDQPHTAVGIKVADCIPVTLIDDAHGVIANIHSGWRGSVQRITDVTLDTLEHESGFAAATARAWLGPAIRVCCFEVGEEVVEQFRASYSNAGAFIDCSRGPKPHIDTIGLTKALLEERGVTRVIDVGVCTKCGAGDAGLLRFHSYRREPGRGGRNLAIVAR
jgi:YfiH family protein